MPVLIEHIDAIARKKQRDVLFVRFNDPETQISASATVATSCVHWRELPIRQTLIDWLDSNQIDWDLCGPIASVNGMPGYRGQIYIDVPFDPNLPECQSVLSFLEYPDGTFRFPEAELCCLRLETAMLNAAHDEPGFWERAAEGF
jgi:hypothetical protein